MTVRLSPVHKTSVLLKSNWFLGGIALGILSSLFLTGVIDSVFRYFFTIVAATAAVAFLRKANKSLKDLQNILSDCTITYAELLKICSKHNGGKSLFDDIAEWAQYHTAKDPNTFRVQSKAQKWNRKKVLKHLREVFQMQGLKPSTEVVTLHDDRKVTVPWVDFADRA